MQKRMSIFLVGFGLFISLILGVAQISNINGLTRFTGFSIRNAAALSDEDGGASEPVYTATDYYGKCKEGYFENSEGNCVKIRVCKTGYIYNASINACDKMTCPFSYKAGADGKCHKFECDGGKILSATSGKCVANNLPDKGQCEAGFGYDPDKKRCKELVPEDAPECGGEEYLEKGTPYICREIANLSAYDKWKAMELVSINDATVLDPGRFLDENMDSEIALEQGLVIAPLGRIPGAAGSNSGVETGVTADIMSAEYAELREMIEERLTEKELLEPAEQEVDEIEPDEPVCPEGKVLNPATGRCRTRVTVSYGSTSITTTTFDPETGQTTTVKVCISGYTLNPETNRCNKIASNVGSLKTCGSGQFLNPATNRCKNLTTKTVSSTSTTITTYDPLTGESKTVKICIDGYELNEETNRCRKIKENSGADFALDLPELGVISESPQVFIALAVVITAIVIGLVFAIFQFRKDIFKFIRKIFRK